MWSKQEAARTNCSLKPQRSQNNSIEVARLKMDFLLWVWLITGLAFQFPCFPSGPPPPGFMWNAHLSQLYRGNRWKLKCKLTVQKVHFGTFWRVSACLLDWLQDFSHIHGERVFFFVCLFLSFRFEPGIGDTTAHVPRWLMEQRLGLLFEGLSAFITAPPPQHRTTRSKANYEWSVLS